MAETYRFFDSTDTDERLYTADEFAEYFRQVLSDGVFNGGTNLKVESTGKNMETYIQPGYAWLQGYLYAVKDTRLPLQHPYPHATLDRIDRVVIRLDKRLEHRYVKAFVKEGTPSTTPSAPALTRNDNVFEISLAQVKIVKGKSYIEGYQITDERLDKNVCGIVNSLIQADTTTIFNQFKHWFDSRTADFEKEWKDWLEEMKDKGGGEFGVTSVNGKTGDVVLMAKDVGAPSKNDLLAYALKGEPAGQYTPTFLNGWYVQAGEVKGVCYYKDQFGYVHLYGTCSGTKTEFGTPLFNLPAGFRPSGVIRVGCLMINFADYSRSIQFLGVYPSGEVLVESYGLPGFVSFTIFPSTFYGQR
ncbi:hypothetical protein [Paenibacillus larvae]|uniref:hypothetical protein n=1 Tax=Paenibacillus larvae TaxID=1464 RepID=UPI0023A981F2|nr:hypothetical protein [Paenibacillus larvae]MDE5168579.1 hypothetical protein [Paenibacillus larvae subsp. larvae]MDR5600802.1 hypothetical protein [Paenibacillus larvae]